MDTKKQKPRKRINFFEVFYYVKYTTFIYLYLKNISIKNVLK